MQPDLPLNRVQLVHRVEKGTEIVARWFETTPASLAGTQPKVAAKEHVVHGVVTKIRGNDSVNPTIVRFTVQQDDGSLVDVDAKHVVEVVRRVP